MIPIGILSGTVPVVYTDITMDPLNTDSSMTLSNGDLTVTHVGPGTFKSSYATLGKGSGRWYWEFTFDEDGGVDNAGIAGAGSDLNTNTYMGNTAGGSASFRSNRTTWLNTDATSNSTSFSDWTQGDTLMIALDMVTGKIWFGKNGAWDNLGDPATGALHSYSDATLMTGTWFAGVTCASNGSSVTMNFGATPFVYTIPLGFQSYDGRQSG